MIREDINKIYAKPVTFPIYQTTSYIVPDGENYRYSREYNPTVENLGKQIMRMEGSEDYNVFSSGMGAITTTLLALSNPGDRILTHLDIFARSYHFMKDFMGKWGINTDISVPGTENIIKSIRKDTKIVFIENNLHEITVIKMDQIDSYIKSIQGSRMDSVPENSAIIDLRLPSEYEKWHIPGSINMDLKSLNSLIKSGDKSKVYFFYCKKGLNSAYASSIMISNGFKSFYSTEKDLKKEYTLNN